MLARCGQKNVQTRLHLVQPIVQHGGELDHGLKVCLPRGQLLRALVRYYQAISNSNLVHTNEFSPDRFEVHSMIASHNLTAFLNDLCYSGPQISADDELFVIIVEQ